MGNPFQDQLLKAGLVNKKQVKKANQEKNRNKKKQRQNNSQAVDEVSLKIRKEAEEKAKRDQQLNKIKNEQARNKAIFSEVNQLITNNFIKRDAECSVAYNFEHGKKINRIYINDDMKRQLILGKLGIALVDEHYELVPLAIAEKIKQRDESRVIIIENNTDSPTDNEDDPYADYQIPDDLTW